MAEFKVRCDDSLEPRIIDGFCRQYNYQLKVQNPDGSIVDNPISRYQFTTDMICQFVKEVTAAAEANIAIEVAKKAAVDKARAELVFI